MTNQLKNDGDRITGPSQQAASCSLHHAEDPGANNHPLHEKRKNGWRENSPALRNGKRVEQLPNQEKCFEHQTPTSKSATVTEQASKRKAQNRAAQKALRERKFQPLHNLECRVVELEHENTVANIENAVLRKQLARLQVELGTLKTDHHVDKSFVGSDKDFIFSFDYPLPPNERPSAKALLSSSPISPFSSDSIFFVNSSSSNENSPCTIFGEEENHGELEGSNDTQNAKSEVSVTSEAPLEDDSKFLIVELLNNPSDTSVPQSDEILNKMLHFREEDVNDLCKELKSKATCAENTFIAQPKVHDDE